MILWNVCAKLCPILFLGQISLKECYKNLKKQIGGKSLPSTKRKSILNNVPEFIKKFHKITAEVVIFIITEKLQLNVVTTSYNH
jgi:hypothetical protein